MDEGREEIIFIRVEFVNYSCSLNCLIFHLVEIFINPSDWENFIILRFYEFRSWHLVAKIVFQFFIDFAYHIWFVEI